MSKSSHTLKIQKGSTVYTCDLYTTTEEARSNLYPNYPLFRVNIDGQTLYAPFTTTLTSETESTPLICPIFEKDNNLTKYCVAQKSFFAINITTVANETITVTAGGTSWNTTGNHWFPYGTTWTASVAGATGYNAGALNASSGTLTNANVTVTAGAASLKTYILKVNATSHQTITLKYKNRNAANTGYEAEVTKTITTSAGSYTVRHGTTWTASVAGATGWNAGTITSSGTVTGNVTLTASAATHKTVTLTHRASNTHQTLVVKYKNYNGSSYAAEATLASGQSVTVGYGTTWTATLTAATGCTRGTLSPGSSGTMSGNVTVSATAGTVNKYVLRFDKSNLIVRYNNSSGSEVSSSTSISYNQVLYVQRRKNASSYSIRLYKNSSASGSVWMTKTTKTFTFNMPNSQVYIQDKSTDSSGD